MNARQLALLIALAAPALAQAAPITASASNLDGPFTVAGSFQLQQGQLFQGFIETVSRQSNDLVIDALLLTRGGETKRFDWLVDSTRFTSDALTERTLTIKGKTIPEWVRKIEISPVWLDAGDWTLSLVGSDSNQKSLSSVSVTLNAQPNRVPLPSTLALAALGLLGLALRGRASTAR